MLHSYAHRKASELTKELAFNIKLFFQPSFQVQAGNFRRAPGFPDEDRGFPKVLLLKLFVIFFGFSFEVVKGKLRIHSLLLMASKLKQT